MYIDGAYEPSDPARSTRSSDQPYFPRKELACCLRIFLRIFLSTASYPLHCPCLWGSIESRERMAGRAEFGPDSQPPAAQQTVTMVAAEVAARRVEERREELGRAFKGLDGDGSGAIDFNELVAAASMIGTTVIRVHRPCQPTLCNIGYCCGCRASPHPRGAGTCIRSRRRRSLWRDRAGGVHHAGRGAGGARDMIGC
jgi:hypothetical protein